MDDEEALVRTDCATDEKGPVLRRRGVEDEVEAEDDENEAQLPGS